MPSKKMLSAAALAAALAGGAMFGAIVGAPSLSGAQESDSTTTTAPAQDEGQPPGDCADGGFRHVRGDGLEAAAKALGMEEADLRSALRDGKSIADVAKEKGVDVQKVIDAIVADHTAKIDEAVAAGKLDEDRAAQIKENMVERVTAMVNGEMRDGRGPGHRHGGRGSGPHMDMDGQAQTEGASYGA